MKKFAVRNIRLCTKDCICLYVCPTGATDTENSIIDVDKCIGCGACADACPSSAISLVPAEFPPQQPKADEVASVLAAFAQRKGEEERAALQLAAHAEGDGLFRLMVAVAKSERYMEEDLMREAGYMLPQSKNVREVLQRFADNPPLEDFPVDTVRKLLESLPCNEEE